MVACKLIHVISVTMYRGVISVTKYRNVNSVRGVISVTTYRVVIVIGVAVCCVQGS